MENLVKEKMTEPKDIFQTIETYFGELHKNQKLKALVTADQLMSILIPLGL